MLSTVAGYLAWVISSIGAQCMTQHRKCHMSSQRCSFSSSPSLLQEALSVTDRVYSVSAETVAPCGQLQVACTQTAPTEEELTDTDYLTAEVLPYVDGIITSTPNASISPLFAFSASTDPGWLPLQCRMPHALCHRHVHVWVHACMHEHCRLLACKYERKRLTPHLLL